MIKHGNSIKEVENSFIGTANIPLEIKHIRNQQNFDKKNSLKVFEFTQIMEQLISSGLSIKDSLDVLSEVEDNNIANEILEEIKKGKSFADAINDMREIFPSLYRGIILIGDKVGSVEKIFPRLRIYLENQKKIKDKITGALIYPSVVLFTTIIGAVLLALFVFPKLQLMFQEFGGEAASQLQTNIQNLRIGLLIVGFFLSGILMFFGMFSKFSKDKIEIKKIKDKLLLKIPIISSFLISFETLNFSFAMETLTAGGVTIENALKEAAAVISNIEYKNCIEKVLSDIVKGDSLFIAFSKYKIFPQYMKKWMKVGERSGKTEQIFFQIRNYYQNEIEIKTTKFMSLIEPALIIVIGIFLLILVLTIIVPIFSLYGSIL